MKRITIYLCLTVLAAALGGCEKFLERSAQDLYLPTTTEDYANILRGESYFPKILSKYIHVAMMTDDVEWFDINKHAGFDVSSYTPDSRYLTYLSSYTWQQEIEDQYFSDEAYNFLYKQAQIAILCLENVESSRGTEAEKEILRGQASFIRAFSYLMLANLYAAPYGKSQPSDPCVPIKTESTPSTGKFARSTMQQVYDQILGDIATALADLEGKDEMILNPYEIRYSAALVLAVRTALYMEKWDDVIKYGQMFIDLGEHPLYDMSTMTAAVNNTSQNPDATIINFINFNNKEATWIFGERSGSSSVYNGFLNFMGFACGGYRVSGPKPVVSTSGGSATYAEGDPTGTFIGIYDYDFATQQGDRRLPYWFMRPVWKYNSYAAKISNYVPLKFDYKDEQYRGEFSLRAGEVYISMAEAYARKSSPDAGQAISLLNQLRSKRISPYTALAEQDFASPDALVEFIWEERRRELCMEELHRWWDLRRTTQPRIEHRVDGRLWVLEQNDPAYILNFPASERIYNGDVLVGNPRPDRLSTN